MKVTWKISWILINEEQVTDIHVEKKKLQNDLFYAALILHPRWKLEETSLVSLIPRKTRYSFTKHDSNTPFFACFSIAYFICLGSRCFSMCKILIYFFIKGCFAHFFFSSLRKDNCFFFKTEMISLCIPYWKDSLIQTFFCFVFMLDPQRDALCCCGIRSSSLNSPATSLTSANLSREQSAGQNWSCLTLQRWEKQSMKAAGWQ